MTIKEKLIAFRKEYGFTQQEVADLIGVERSTYACYENGKANVPIGKIQLLAVVYNMELSDFISTTVVEFRSGPDLPVPQKEEKKMSVEERITLAKMRLLCAMGKEEELNQVLDELVKKE